MNTAILASGAEQYTLLRRAIQADSIVTGASGLLLTLAAGSLSDLFDLPTLLLRLAGFSLLPYTAGVLYIATRASIPRRGAWAVIGLNLLWAVASLLLLATGWVDPSTLGITFVVAQALIVAAFADVQYLAQRRSNG